MKKNKITCFMIELVTLLTAVNGCGQKLPPVSEEITSGEFVDEALEGKTGEGSLEAYRLKLSGTGDAEDIYRFVEDNIGRQGSKEADQMIAGLIDFVGDENAVDYARLSVFEDLVSPEMAGFLKMMITEQKEPALSQQGIEVSLGELLERVITAEDQIERFPDGLTYKYACKKYTGLLCAAVTGGYDRQRGIPNAYAEKEILKASAIEEYAAFAENYECTESAGVVRDYLDLLGKNENRITADTEEFYGGLAGRIQAAL